VVNQQNKNGQGSKLDAIVASARAEQDATAKGYRKKALKLYPWVCGRCSREFTQQNLIELTVHHRDHNHDNNPQDGSNWELLCLYCHDNEHQRFEEQLASGSGNQSASAVVTHNPFANIKDLFKG
jgi:hypothetical protein